MKASLLILVTLALLGCNKGQNQPPASNPAPSKHYQLKGKVLSIDKRANMANIDGEDIPGFMSAMIMPYVVKPASQLDKLSPGDLITADVVVEDDNSWIENVVITGHAPDSPK